MWVVIMIIFWFRIGCVIRMCGKRKIEYFKTWFPERICINFCHNLSDINGIMYTVVFLINNLSSVNLLKQGLMSLWFYNLCHEGWEFYVAYEHLFDIHMLVDVARMKDGFRFGKGTSGMGSVLLSIQRNLSRNTSSSDFIFYIFLLTEIEESCVLWGNEMKNKHTQHTRKHNMLIGRELSEY